MSGILGASIALFMIALLGHIVFVCNPKSVLKHYLIKCCESFCNLFYKCGCCRTNAVAMLVEHHSSTLRREQERRGSKEAKEAELEKIKRDMFAAARRGSHRRAVAAKRRFQEHAADFADGNMEEAALAREKAEADAEAAKGQRQRKGKMSKKQEEEILRKERQKARRAKAAENVVNDAVAKKILQGHDDEVFITNLLNDEIDEQEKELLAEVKSSFNPLNFRGGMFTTFEPYKMKSKMFTAIPKLEWLKAEAIQLTAFDAAAHADKVIKYWCKRTAINIPATLLKRKSRTQEFEKWAGPIAQDLAKHVASGKAGKVDIHLLDNAGALGRANSSPAAAMGGNNRPRRVRRASVSGELSSTMKRKGKKKRKPSSGGAMFDALDGKGGGRKRRKSAGAGLAGTLDGKGKSKKKRRKRRASMAVSTAGALAEIQGGGGRKRRGSSKSKRKKKEKRSRKKSAAAKGGGDAKAQPPPPPQNKASLI